MDSLYRRLLRAHRSLPREMRSLGDDYVKAEFRRHKEVTNPAHIIGFLSQWKMYLDDLPMDGNGKDFAGKKLDPTVFEKASAPMSYRSYPTSSRCQLDVCGTARAALRTYACYEGCFTFDHIAQALGKDEVWVAAAFYGQAKLTSDELTHLSRILGISNIASLGALGDHWWPNRGLGPMPPTDPVIYRLYEVCYISSCLCVLESSTFEGVLVYGHAIKVKFQDVFNSHLTNEFASGRHT
ncbi:hypothetical protein C0992_008999 [Termitomyces sp. T32_za158]|nr:hypothetical protein C0992_008999 [Termitomyces sp. T32_za158]